MAFYKSAEEYYAEMTSTMSDVDISEHSLIYNALMPVCYELAYQSLMLDEALKMVFIDSAVENGYGEYVEKRTLEQGVTRKQETYASGTVKLIGKAKSKLPSGSKVSTTLGFIYTTQADCTINDDGVGYVNIIADGIGSKYNVDVGEINLLPVKYEGIYSVTNEEKIDNGYDEESDEELYNRYLLKVQNPATSGNENDYLQWALEVSGVGFAKVYPLWNGNGTLKVVIADSNRQGADSELVEKVKEYIETQRPIGATVTVVSAEELALNISLKLSYNSKEYTLDQVKTNIKNSLNDYLKTIAFVNTYVSITKIGALIFNSSGIIDYSDLTINGGTENITIADGQIPVLGEVTISEIS